MDIKKQIKVALGLEEEEVKLGFQAKTEDGTIVVSTADEPVSYTHLTLPTNREV